MILRPLDQPAPRNHAVTSAWDAVMRTQQMPARRYALIRQPDHARLSGDLARHFAIGGMPPITEEILQGISLHDEGWAPFDSGRERLQASGAQYSAEGVAVGADGKPLSFLEITPGDFLRAWRDSIAAAERVAPIAALIVSGHFCRLGEGGVEAGRYAPAETKQVRQFLREEEVRRERLSRLETRTPAEIEYWTDVLQFCDLLSLYLCCGSEENVRFPQRVASQGATVELRVQDGTMRLSPALMAAERAFTTPAQIFPGGESVDLQWKVR